MVDNYTPTYDFPDGNTAYGAEVLAELTAISSALNQLPTLSEIKSLSFFDATCAGTGTLYTITRVYPLSEYSDQSLIAFVPNITNTGNVTVNIDGRGVRSILTHAGAQLPAGAIVKDMPVLMIYSQTNNCFFLVSDGALLDLKIIAINASVLSASNSATAAHNSEVLAASSASTATTQAALAAASVSFAKPNIISFGFFINNMTVPVRSKLYHYPGNQGAMTCKLPTVPNCALGDYITIACMKSFSTSYIGWGTYNLTIACPNTNVYISSLGAGVSLVLNDNLLEVVTLECTYNDGVYAFWAIARG